MMIIMNRTHPRTDHPRKKHRNLMIISISIMLLDSLENNVMVKLPSSSIEKLHGAGSREGLPPENAKEPGVQNEIIAPPMNLKDVGFGDGPTTPTCTASFCLAMPWHGRVGLTG